MTAFDHSILKIERLLLNSLIYYIGSSSQFTGKQKTDFLFQKPKLNGYNRF